MFDEAVGIVGLDAPPPQCLGEHRVVGDEASADLVHEVVGVADHHGDQCLDPGEQSLLFRRPNGTEDEIRAYHLLQFHHHLLQFHHGLGSCHRAEATHEFLEGFQVEVVHEFLEGGRVVAEGASVPGEEIGEGRAHVRHAEYGMVHRLVEANPQPQVVGREVPLAAEVGHVRGDHEERVVGAWDREVVGAEAAYRQPADQRAGHHPGDERADRGKQPLHPGGGRIVLEPHRDVVKCRTLVEGLGEAPQEGAQGVEAS